MHIDVNGTRLWFDVEGAGLAVDGHRMRARPTVVLVHGGPGSYDHTYLRPDFDRLAALAQVVYLDLRDHGLSAWGSAEDWTLEDCADDIHAFCSALGIERPVVLGHSLGAPVVLLYGARHPGQAAGLVVSGPFARWDHDRLVAAFDRVGGAEVAELADRSFTVGGVTEEEWARVYRAYGRPPDPERRATRPQNLAVAEHGGRLVRSLDIVDQLAQIDVPVLVSVGEDDPVTPLGAAQEIVANLPAGLARLDAVPGGGHFTWLDAPDAFWPAVEEFVTEVGRKD